MIQKYIRGLGLFCSLMFLLGVNGKAQPIVVEGVTDESTGGARSIRIQTSPGYSYLALLNGVRIPTDVIYAVNQADYYELTVYRTNAVTMQVTSQLIKFIVRAPDRGDTEDGLPAWVPYPVIPSASAEFAGARLQLIAPETMPAGLEIPVIAWIKDDNDQAVRVNGMMSASGHSDIKIRRGVGSGLLASTHPAGTLTYSAQVGPLASNKNINIEGGTTWTTVSGNVSGNVVWGPDARISVTGHINIPDGSTLTINSGTVVRLDSGVNITNFGRIILQGSTERPIVFTPVSRAQPWGGFWLNGLSNGAQLDGEGAIFIASGSRTGFPGHRREQPLFFLTNQCRVALTNSIAMDLAGQLHHSRSNTPRSDFTMVGSLVQRLTTAGEFNYCNLTFLRSALIEIPYEDQFYCSNPDCDHDGFYLNTGTHQLRDSLLGWLKDDCIDSGSGGEQPVVVNVSNCWFEAAYHEACAWSNARRSITNTHLVTINSGQGIEAGWSGGTPPSPYVFASDCLSLANASGFRYGDNYDWDYWGFLRVTNSFALYNHRDVHGREWDSWNYRSDAMDIRGNFLTAPNTNHPNNAIWNPVQDGWRLASFLTTPANAPVGIGFATWPNQTNMSFLVTGVPVGLSSFATNTVQIDYTFESGGNTLQTGTLTFLPGQTIKRIQPSAFNVAGLGVVNVTLSNPVGGELSGVSAWTFGGAYVTPQMSARVSGAQRDIVRLAEGVPIGLSLPAAHTPTIDFEYRSASGVLSAGTFALPAGQTLAWLPAPNVNPQDYDLVRLSLRNPSGASFTGVTNIYFVRTAAAATPPPTTFVSLGSTWKYLDNGIDQGTGWRQLGFNDNAWASGPAQLGYGENDEATPISFGGVSNNKYPTYYFRHAFSVTGASNYATLSFRLLRDDGAVVYLNGGEVFRHNMPAGTITYTTPAQNAADDGKTLWPTNVSASSLDEGPNLLAVEVHQDAPDSSDVSFDIELVGNPAPLPPPPQRVFTADFDGQMTIAWGDAGFVLEYADDVAGPWSPAGSGSPFVILPSQEQRFFRLRKL